MFPISIVKTRRFFLALRKRIRRAQYCTHVIAIIMCVTMTIPMATANFTVTMAPAINGVSDYSVWHGGTAYPCRTMEECAVMFNDTELTETLTETLLVDEADLGPPCIVQGHLQMYKNWYGYIATFKLRPNYAALYYRFVYPKGTCCVKILLYLHEDIKKMRKNMNCLQRQTVIEPGSDQVLTLSGTDPSVGCKVEAPDADGVECTSGRILRSDRELTWYMAASSCGSPSGLDLQYLLVIYGVVGDCPNNTQSNSATKTGLAFATSPCNVPSILVILCTSLTFSNQLRTDL